MKTGLLRAQQPGVVLSSSALGAVVGTDGGEFGVGFRHEGLQLFLEQLIRGLGGRRLHRCALGTVLETGILILLGTVLEIAALPVLTAVAAPEIVGPAGVFPLGLGLQPLDGQVDLAVFAADNHDLYILTLGQMLADVADIGICYFGNMYHAGLVFGQGHKSTEIGDGFYFTF